MSLIIFHIYSINSMRKSRPCVTLQWQVKQGSSVANTSLPIRAAVQLLRGSKHKDHTNVTVHSRIICGTVYHRHALWYWRAQTGQQDSGPENKMLLLGQSTSLGHCFRKHLRCCSPSGITWDTNTWVTTSTGNSLTNLSKQKFNKCKIELFGTPLCFVVLIKLQC